MKCLIEKEQIMDTNKVISSSSNSVKNFYQIKDYEEQGYSTDQAKNLVEFGNVNGDTESSLGDVAEKGLDTNFNFKA
jgi:hypothetical protein